MATTASRLRTLAERIKHRREELEISMRDAALLAGMSLTTWNNAENGEKRPHGVTLAKIDRVLQWQSGTCSAILAGKPVTSAPREKPKPDDTVDLVKRWAQTERGLEPHEREYILAIIAKTQPRNHGDD